MSAPREQIRVYRGSLPLWLVLAVALPVGAVLMTSLILAALIAVAGAGVAALLLPRLLRARRGNADDAIELDATQFRRVDDRNRRPREEE